MKIAVYGASGMVGTEITAEALRRGHDVTAVTRSGADVAGATARVAELSDLASFTDLASHDVIVLAVAPDRTGQSHEPFLEAHRAIAASGVPARVFIVGGAGATEIDGVQLKDLPGFPTVYKAEATTMGAILDDYRSSTDLDWTMLSPAPVIAPGERTGSYVLGVDSPAGDAVSTQDYAVAVLDELETPRHPKRRFTVAN
ncbi:NAD(P)-dependent oxidoreductase [Leifsonia sp. YAF41]|uniref:NAD(P)-dependent oxidoreductase n=1 Tax=Leifsonia sp. YAF41 TaxID=3233086 RepID=UPI003F969CB6